MYDVLSKYIFKNLFKQKPVLMSYRRVLKRLIIINFSKDLLLPG